VRILDSHFTPGLELTHDDYIDKVHKAEYVNLQIEFIDCLTNLSLSLKTISYPKELDRQADERKAFL